MKRFLQVALRAGVPFGVAMGLFYYVQNRQPIAILIGLIAGLLFGIAMAFTQRCGERRLQRLGLSTGDMRPVQERTVSLPLDINAALMKSRTALNAIRKVQTASIFINENQITATTGMTWQSFGERISVDIQPAADGSTVRISSRPKVATTIMDSGKGLENVELFARSVTQ